MSADKKPVWLDDQAHTILKDYAKLVKKSATDVTSDLVLNYLHLLDSSDEVVAAASAAPAVEEVVVAEAPDFEEEEETNEPSRYVEVSAEQLGSKRTYDTAVIPKRERKQRQDDGSVRYLGGVKFY